MMLSNFSESFAEAIPFNENIIKVMFVYYALISTDVPRLLLLRIV